MPRSRAAASKTKRAKRVASRGKSSRRNAIRTAANIVKIESDQNNRAPPEAVRHRWHADALKTWGVIGTYLGRKRVKGKWTKELALICLVEQKLEMSAVRKEQRIPKRVRWQERGRGHWLRTDVVQGDATVELQQGILGPGDGVRSVSSGTLGAVIDHPVFGRCVMTAGHVCGGPPGEGKHAVAASGSHRFDVTVKRCQLQRTVDYAVLQPAAGSECDNLFQDRVRIGPVLTPTASELGKPVFILTDAGAIRAMCRGIHARLQTAVGTYEDLILTTPVTRPGMSGAALVDSKGHLWGFLLGIIGQHSVFMPATLPLTAEQAKLVD